MNEPCLPFTRWLFHAEQRRLCLVHGSRGPQLPPRANVKGWKEDGGLQGTDVITLVFSTQPMKRIHWHLLSCGIFHIMGGHADVQAISKMTPTASLRREKCLRPPSPLPFLLQPSGIFGAGLCLNVSTYLK